MAPGPSRFAASALDLGPVQWAAPTWGADSISRAAQTTPARLLREPSQGHGQRVPRPRSDRGPQTPGLHVCVHEAPVLQPLS